MSLSTSKEPRSAHPTQQVEKGHFRGASLWDTQFVRCPLRITTPTFLIGTGTTACIAVMLAIRHLLENVERIPDVVGHLLIDSEADVARDSSNFVGLASYGAGTDATKGRKIFEEARPRIHEALLAHMQLLLKGDPSCPTAQSARQATSVHIVAGSGGTSGGSLHPMISVVHEVARKLSIQKLHVNVHLIGPDMPMRDVERTTSPEQRDVVNATFGRNVERLLTDLAKDEELVEKSTDGRQIAIRSRDRVRSVSLIDQTNGHVDFLTTGDLTSLFGWTLAQRCFTAAGMHHEARIEDEIGLDVPFGL